LVVREEHKVRVVQEEHLLQVQQEALVVVR
jgi:hypothetical protein